MRVAVADPGISRRGCTNSQNGCANLLLPAATKLGQGNVFTGVCDSVHRGGVCLSACWDTHPPGADTPGSRHPPRPDTPLGADMPPEQTSPPGANPPGANTPGSRHPPTDTPRARHPLPPGSRHPPSPPREQTLPHLTPPRKQTPAYGQRVAGTHPTGMHSCFAIFFAKNCMKMKEFGPPGGRTSLANPLRSATR